MSTPAGWYPDASGTTRYWDGVQWTEHIVPEAPVPPLHLQAEDTQQYQQQLHAQHFAHPQAVPHQQQYYSAVPTPNGIGVAGFVVGLVSMFLPLIFGLATGAAGLVMSIVGLSRSRATGTARGLSIAGIILSSIGIILIF